MHLSPETVDAEELRPKVPRPGLLHWVRASRLAAAVTALGLALVTWYVVSELTDHWLPTLGQVDAGVRTVLKSPELISDFGTTIRRVLEVWVCAFAVGVVVGVAAGFRWRLRAFLRPIMVIALAIPDLVYIILAILILGPKESSSIFALVFAISPLVANVVMDSTLDRDPRIDEMAAVYRFSRATYARHVLWNQIRPALGAGARTSFAFSWKLIVLVEVITSPNGVGAEIGTEFRYLRPANMIAYALLFTVFMRLIEVLVIDRVFPRSARAEEAR